MTRPRPDPRLAALPTDDRVVPDDQIASRVLAGDHVWFAVLMRRHNQRIFRAVRSIVRSDHEAEEVVQQAFVSAFHRLSQFRGEAQLATWLTRIAVNEALGKLRAQNRHGGEMSLVTDDTIDESTVARTPEDAAASHELGKVLEAHIDRLPPGYRTVFVLRDVQELDTAETASSLGLSEEAVRVRLHRARHMLQSSLTEAMGSAGVRAFRFDGARCDRIVLAVAIALGFAPAPR